MFQDPEISRYIDDVLAMGELYIEINRIQKCLVSLHKNPNPDKEFQQRNVQKITRMFQALLLTKESRQEVIENI